MKKIRVNELARELEVPNGVVIDLLPLVGVDEKKTHSSSIDEDVALRIRDRYMSDGKGGVMPRPDTGRGGAAVATPTRPDVPEVRPETGAGRFDGESRAVPDGDEPPRTVPPPATTPTAPAASSTNGSSTPSEAAPAPADVTAKPEEPRPLRPSGMPIRPPLLGMTPPAPVAPPTPEPPSQAVPALPAVPAEAPTAGVAISAPTTPVVAPLAPARPLSPPTAGVVPGGPKPPAAPSAPPAAPGRPQPPAPPQARGPQPGAPRPGGPPPAPAQRPGTAAPPRNQPLAARPGQILSGPRQPLPGADAPRPAAAPGAPRPTLPPPPARPPQPPRPPLGAPTAPGALGAPSAPRPTGPQQGGMPTRPPLAGQPAARPIVPPNPALAARLAQNRPLAPAAPMPGAPRPAPPMPGRPTQPTMPGRPLYQGPPRPGQGGPGGFRPAGPGGFNRGPRPMHPTSPLAPGMAPPPPPGDAQRRRQAQRPGGVRYEREEEGRLKPMHARRNEQAAPPPIDREITISEGITVKELSEKLNVKANMVIQKLVKRGVFATINQALDVALAEQVSREFGASTNQISYEEEAVQDVVQTEVETDLVTRAPVVTVMGHVDHGKTSLLDAIRSANVAAREAGGITQHIGAYQVEKNGRKIVFIDTPGHQAFTRMRARGAKVTDVVILVVSADDGVMPQTLEAIDHARAANVPMIVAINKIDKPGALPERVKQQLADRGVLSEDYGGDTVMVPVSAKTQQNLDLLLEMILLQADILELKANPARSAVGVVLEAKLDKGRGPVATVIVRNGTLRVGDPFLCGSVFGKVRAMYNDLGDQVKDAEPATPVEVLGLDSVPDVGDTFQAVTDVAKAKQISIFREGRQREASLGKGPRITLEQLASKLKQGDTKELLLVLKADVGGTAEVLSDSLQKLSTEKVRVRVLSTGVGAITEFDVLLAAASEAIIIGFNVKPEKKALVAAEQEGVDIRQHSIIYELMDEITKAMTGLLDPVFRQTYQGRAEVREVFRISKVGTVAGCYILDGFVKRNSEVRLLRGGEEVFKGKVDTLKRFKDDVSEVKTGFECGISLVNHNDVRLGDIIEAFVTERVAQEALV